MQDGIPPVTIHYQIYKYQCFILGFLEDCVAEGRLPYDAELDIYVSMHVDLRDYHLKKLQEIQIGGTTEQDRTRRTAKK